MGKPPSESGFERGGWNSKLLAKLMRDQFCIACSRRTTLRAAGRLGFFARKPQPVPYNGAAAKERARFLREKEGAIARRKMGQKAAPYCPYMAPRCRIRHVSRRSLRARGVRGIVRTNHSRKPINLIGAPGDGASGLQFHQNLKADGYIAPL